MDECKHEELKLIGMMINDMCFVCGKGLISSEINILGTFYEVGGYCENRECVRYLILVV